MEIECSGKKLLWPSEIACPGSNKDFLKRPHDLTWQVATKLATLTSHPLETCSLGNYILRQIIGKQWKTHSLLSDAFPLPAGASTHCFISYIEVNTMAMHDAAGQGKRHSWDDNSTQKVTWKRYIPVCWNSRNFSENWIHNQSSLMQLINCSLWTPPQWPCG